MLDRTKKRRGATALVVVLGTSLIVGVFVMGASARLTPACAELIRTRASDQAFGLAEAGITLARDELTRDPSFAGRSGLELSQGLIGVKVDRHGESFVVLSEGKVHPRLARPDEWVTRRVEATLRKAEDGALVVVAWREQ